MRFLRGVITIPCALVVVHQRQVQQRCTVFVFFFFPFFFQYYSDDVALLLLLRVTRSVYGTYRPGDGKCVKCPSCSRGAASVDDRRARVSPPLALRGRLFKFTVQHPLFRPRSVAAETRLSLVVSRVGGRRTKERKRKKTTRNDARGGLRRDEDGANRGRETKMLRGDI